jgi:peptide deformylase
MKEVWLEGVTAQCFQHELDHLDGVCYDENVKPVAMAMARKRQQKLIKRIGKNR